MFWRKIWRGVMVIVLVFLLALVGSNIWVVSSTSGRVFSSPKEIPANQVAVVLGTSNKLTNGLPNPYFESRIRAAAQLFKDGKAAHFILSGDNRSIYYNEPIEMKKAMLREGIPDSVITLDFAGLRTLDTIVRCKEIFGQSKVTIITQSFHCYRAIFISNYYDMDAVALMTEAPATEEASKVYFREYLARGKAVLDLYVLRTSPRYLGEKEALHL